MAGPGKAKSNNFVFSEATLCLAPQATGKLINPKDHSLGLVKNVKITNTTNVAKLTQGVTNEVVDTQVIGITTAFTAEVFEFTPKNMTYGLSLDASTTVNAKGMVFPLNADLAGDGQTPGSVVVSGDVTTGMNPIVAGSWIFVQGGVNDDQVVVGKVAAAPTVANGNSTIALADPLPASMAFSHFNTRVGLIAKIDADQDNMDTSYTARVIGILKSTKTPIVLHFPKVKVMKGFDMTFNSQNFQNMAFEFDVLYPTPSDPGYSPDFGVAFSVFPGSQA